MTGARAHRISSGTIRVLSYAVLAITPAPSRNSLSNNTIILVAYLKHLASRAPRRFGKLSCNERNHHPPVPVITLDISTSMARVRVWTTIGRGVDSMPQASHYRATSQSPLPARQAFHNPHTSYGAGHWVKTAGILAPLVIGEFVKDPDQRWRFIRIAAVATALVSEGLYTHRIRKEREQARERASSCHVPG
jgi:hypothetical protein